MTTPDEQTPKQTTDLSLAALNERIDKALMNGVTTDLPLDVVVHLVDRLRIAEGSVREVTRLAESMEREAPKPAAGGFIAEAVRDALAKGARAAALSIEASL